MNRLTEIKIAGNFYPLNFSTKAAKDISARYGGLENIDKAFEKKTTDAMMDEVVWLLALLISQGVAYKRIAGGEEVKGIVADELEVLLNIGDFFDLKKKILESMAVGTSREIEVEDDPKNAKTTQGE